MLVRIASFVLLIAALIAGAGIGSAEERRSFPNAPMIFSTTELKADGSGHYFADADINGQTIVVMVDTGASGVALSYEDADKVGLRPRGLDYDAPVMTANGMVKAARVMLRRVEVDNVRVRDVDGLVLPEGAMHGSLLGMSFLGRLSSFRIENGVLYLKD